MSWDSLSYPLPRRARLRASRIGSWTSSRLLAAPELVGLLGLTAVLNLWNLSINGWANSYYSAAVRSMSTSWHDFLFASMDKAGLMTVDKPPLSLWVQAISVRVFGFHSLSILVPQALMGVVAVGLLYDLTRRRFGRAAGFAAGLVLASTPIVVAVSRHNNPDELLVLCCVAALWTALKALDTGRTRWIVMTGVLAGLGFETKMAVALMIVPGIAVAWMWIAPRGRIAALRQLLAGGAAMIVVGGAWPLLVMLTPAADRPWISGTSDNSIWSLIFGYNGLGRVAGQSGGPGGGGPGGGSLFGGPTGPFRLLQSGLGDQAGWLLGFAVVSGLALLALTRLRRRDPRTGWLLVVGGAFVTTAVVFSFAQGIFHPYYVSLLAPFAAGLIGAGVGLMRSHGRAARVVAPAAIVGGAITELIVLGELHGAVSWARPLVIGIGGACAVVLALRMSDRVRAAALAVALAALIAAPAVWAAETLGHATSGTFPAGGSATAEVSGPGGPGGPGPAGGGGPGGAAGGFAPGGAAGGSGPAGGGGPGGGFGPGGGAGGAGATGLGPGGPNGVGVPGAPGPAGGALSAGAGAGSFGADTPEFTAAIRYAESHGGGTIGVSSQSTAAAAILSSNANVAGLGGFSGRESSVSVGWLAQEVRAGHLRWIVADQSQGPRLPGDTRTGSEAAFSVVEQVCKPVHLTTSTRSSMTMYDCRGEGVSLERAKTDV